jgi:hypothetical protein
VHSQYRDKQHDVKEKLGERIIAYFIGKYKIARYRTWMLRKEVNETDLHPKYLRRICMQHVFRVPSPLALIAGIHGSGGSLLRRLFDGHPELHAHPRELMIGYSGSAGRPRIDLSDAPERWFEAFSGDMDSEYIEEVYKDRGEDDEMFPFVFLPSLQKTIFLDYVHSIQSIRLRDVFDAYMTSYFGAWLSNRSYTDRKKFVTASAPALTTVRENVDFFFEVYPDGRLIFLVRDPGNWFPFAAARWPRTYGDAGRAAAQWNESGQTMLWSKERCADRVCIIKFEDLISKTEVVMRYLADLLGIEFDDILLVPTFDKFPMKARARFEVKDHGIASGALEREGRLAQQELDTVERMTRATYSAMLAEVITFA